MMPKNCWPKQIYFSNLIGDIETAFSWQALKLEKYQDMAIAYCTQVLKQFTDEDPENLEHIRLKLGEAFWFKGDEASAEAIYQEMIAKHPRWSVSIALSPVVAIST